ncbi:MAG TPA: metalloprotease, partial [Micromonospora sp.]|nr:metalloprotease [Micromonospora sp.]
MALAPVAAQPASAAPQESDGQSPSAVRNDLFLTGPNEGRPESIAVNYLRTNPSRYGVSSADLSDLVVASSYTSSHNGVTHVNLAQRYKNLEVFGATATINIAKDGSVIFVGHSLAPGLQQAPSAAAALDAVDAVESAAKKLRLKAPRSPRVLSRSADAAQRTVVSDSGISEQPIPARLGWQHTDDGLRMAWQLVIDEVDDSHLWNVTIDAKTGEMLEVDDWTSHDNL